MFNKRRLELKFRLKIQFCSSIQRCRVLLVDFERKKRHVSKTTWNINDQKLNFETSKSRWETPSSNKLVITVPQNKANVKANSFSTIFPTSSKKYLRDQNGAFSNCDSRPLSRGVDLAQLQYRTVRLVMSHYGNGFLFFSCIKEILEFWLFMVIFICSNFSWFWYQFSRFRTI